MYYFPSDTPFRLARSALPEPFLTAHRTCCSLFSEWQSATILNNLLLYQGMDDSHHSLTSHHGYCIKQFLRRYPIKPVAHGDKVVPRKSRIKVTFHVYNILNIPYSGPCILRPPFRQKNTMFGLGLKRFLK